MQGPKSSLRSKQKFGTFSSDYETITQRTKETQLTTKDYMSIQGPKSSLKLKHKFGTFLVWLRNSFFSICILLLFLFTNKEIKRKPVVEFSKKNCTLSVHKQDLHSRLKKEHTTGKRFDKKIERKKESPINKKRQKTLRIDMGYLSLHKNTEKLQPFRAQNKIFMGQ